MGPLEYNGGQECSWTELVKPYQKWLREVLKFTTYLVGDNTHIYFHFKVDKNFGFGTSPKWNGQKTGWRKYNRICNRTCIYKRLKCNEPSLTLETPPGGISSLSFIMFICVVLQDYAFNNYSTFNNYRLIKRKFSLTGKYTTYAPAWYWIRDSPYDYLFYN